MLDHKAIPTFSTKIVGAGSHDRIVSPKNCVGGSQSNPEFLTKKWVLDHKPVPNFSEMVFAGSNVRIVSLVHSRRQLHQKL